MELCSLPRKVLKFDTGLLLLPPSGGERRGGRSETSASKRRRSRTVFTRLLAVPSDQSEALWDGARAGKPLPLTLLQP